MGRLPELSELYATTDENLWLSQEKFEHAIIKRIESREQWTLRKMEYEMKYLDAMERCRTKEGTKIPVTLVKDTAQKECFQEYKEMCIAENMKKKFDAYIKLYQERINTIKTIMKIDISRVN